MVSNANAPSMSIMTVIHILAMFVAFAFTTGMGILLTAIASRGDVRAIRAASNAIRPFQIAGSIVLLAGVVVGFGLAQTAGFDLLSRWLVITYVALAGLLYVGMGIHMSWAKRLRAAADASPDDRPSADLNAVIRDRMVAAAGPISGIFWITILAMMVFRPQ